MSFYWTFAFKALPRASHVTRQIRALCFPARQWLPLLCSSPIHYPPSCLSQLPRNHSCFSLLPTPIASVDPVGLPPEPISNAFYSPQPWPESKPQWSLAYITAKACFLTSILTYSSILNFVNDVFISMSFWSTFSYVRSEKKYHTGIVFKFIFHKQQGDLLK